MDSSVPCHIGHSRGLLFNVGRIITDPDESVFKDLDLVCRDGTVKWNKFLLAANSPVLRKVLNTGKTFWCIKESGFLNRGISISCDQLTSTI